MSKYENNGHSHVTNVTNMVS